MEKRSKKAKILIIEDEQPFGESLARHLKSAGYRPEFLARPENALDRVNAETFDVVIIDCLLPGMSGVDLGQRIKEMPNGENTAIVFMSGIYTDKKFIKDAQTTTGSIGFFVKPFEASDLVHLLDTHLHAKSSSPQKRLHELLTKPKASSREKRRAIEALEKVHGFDLPLIFSLLVETRSSGHLNIVNEEGVVSGISFSKGAIVNVDVADEETYIGRLLINHGFIRPVDLESVLSSVNQRKIGERLIQANILSPHALNVALSEQMNIRLSRTIFPGSIELNFVPCEVPFKSPNIEPDEFKSFLIDWVQSKLHLDWLKSLYRYWGAHVFLEGPTFADREQVMAGVEFEEILNLLLNGRTLDEVLEANASNEEEVLRVAHLLVMKRILVLAETQRKDSPEDQLKELIRFSKEMKSKNHLQLFEMLGAGHDQVEEQAPKYFEEFKNWIRTTGDSSDAEVVKLRTAIHARVQEAYNIISDPSALESYRKKLGETAIQTKEQVGTMLDKAKALLEKEQYQKAFDILKQAKGLSSGEQSLKLYMIWAKIGVENPGKNPNSRKSIDKDLQTIPPEERYSALYAFVQGKFLKAIGDKEQAKRAFEKAIFMDPKMIEAKREISTMGRKAPPKKMEKPASKGGLFSSLFKKKSS